jgi:hypothetical protein
MLSGQAIYVLGPLQIECLPLCSPVNTLHKMIPFVGISKVPSPIHAVSGAEAVSFAPMKKMPTSASVGLSSVSITDRGSEEVYVASGPAFVWPQADSSGSPLIVESARATIASSLKPIAASSPA